LFDAESIKWPITSRGDHLPGAGCLALSASLNASSAGVAWSRIARNSVTYDCIDGFTSGERKLERL